MLFRSSSAVWLFRIAGVAALALVLPALATHSKAAPEDAPPELAAEVPALSELDWLAGHWRQNTERGWTEELWTPAKGELMVGLNRSQRAGRERASFEYLRLERRPEGIIYLASPSGSSPTPFRLVEHEPQRAVFANPDNEFPTHIEYVRDGDQLTASIRAATPGPSWTFELVTELD